MGGSSREAGEGQDSVAANTMERRAFGLRTSTEVWHRIQAHQGEQFSTITGLSFTYDVDGDVLVTDRTPSRLYSSEFERALAKVPLDRPRDINKLVRGPSYVWAILHDDRIRQNDW
jgi:hypothetical protein